MRVRTRVPSTSPAAWLRSIPIAVIALLAGAHARAADLIVTGVDVSQVVTDCQTLAATGTISATVENAGTSSTGVAFTVLFFEDQNGNGVYDPGTDLVLGDAAAGPLGPGGQATVSTTVSATVAFAGNLMYALADSDNDVTETDETNNVANSGLRCIYQPGPGPYTLVEEWQWESSTTLPDHTDVMMTPIVVNLTDDNGDGLVNDGDVPDVVFSAWTGASENENGVLRAVSGDDGTEIFTTPLTDELDIWPTASLAAGDIDGDGLPEIIASEDIIDEFGGSTNNWRLIVFEHDGTFKFKSIVGGPRMLRWGGAAIADLNGDGTPEIVVGRYILDNNGGFVAQGLNSYFGDNEMGMLSTVADIDRDGHPDIVAGAGVYNVVTTAGVITGVTDKWTSGDPVIESYGGGFPGVGNFDADDRGEVVSVVGGDVYLFDDDGTLLWTQPIPLGGRGGPPNIDDFDNDGQVEVGVAGASRYIVFDTDGTPLWESTIQDVSSQCTGSSVFDFEGDGAAEVVFKDEVFLRVYRGTDGLILAQVPTGSGTACETPVIADVDRDGNAEIIVCANNHVFGTETGIQVFGDANDQWVNARRIWNQHTYHITNVNDDATIPSIEADNWLTYNNFRSQEAGDAPGGIFAAPDLTASYIREDSSACPNQTGLVARIGNGGSNVAAAPVNVAFYDGDPGSGGVLLGVVQTTQNLDPGEFEDITLLIPALDGPHFVCAVADDDGAGNGAQSECDETNNKCCTQFEDFCLMLPICDAGGPYFGLVGQPVTFDGSNSSDPDGGAIVAYDWTFGDGGTGSGPTPTHTYAAPGTYTVTLTVTDDDGQVSSCTTEAEIDTVVPVQMSFMEGTARGNVVTLRWRTSRESSGVGFHVHRRASGQGETRVRITERPIESAGERGGAYTYDDRTVEPDRTYEYWLEDVDPAGTGAFHGPIEVRVGAPTPEKLLLHAARPNPFNPSTTIGFELPEAAFVTLTIFGPDGRAVRTLVDEKLGAGVHSVQWDGRDEGARPLASGVYLCRLEAGDKVLTRKMALAK